jgi:hypothetical protein
MQFPQRASYKQNMSEANTAVEEPAEEGKAPVRLRRPERRQVAMVVQCPDDLVGPSHPVPLVMAVVEKLDVWRFAEPIKAREGGRGGTQPIRNCWWHCSYLRVLAASARHGSWRGAAKTARLSVGCAAGWE